MLAAYLVFTTILGARLAGKQSTIREFFLAGRKIPWLAVAGSNIATEISAVTLISVPAAVYAAGGDLTYLQLALGALLARIIVGIWFVRAFYEREIYSPYEYMGNRLGPQVRTVTSGLFVLGAVLGQSVRVLLTAIVLQIISGIPLTASIWLIGLAAVIWTLLGGITTVIWTDVIQFFVFLVGMLVALAFVLVTLPGGWSEMWSVAGAHDKLRLWNLSTDPNQAFTLWAALIGNTIMCLAVYGTDQTMAQRMFCCRGPRQATYAVIASSAGLIVTVIAVFVGLGLFAFYNRFPLSGQALAAVNSQSDRIFPVFILERMPVGVVGLIIAGIFAAAISTLDGVLVALSQVVLTAVYRPRYEKKQAARQPVESSRPSAAPTSQNAPAGAAEAFPAATANPEAAEERRRVAVSKVLVVVWAVVLCAMAQVSKLAWDHYRDILNLALAMATYTGGPMLAAFALAFFRLNVDYRGILWATPLSVLTVFAITWHALWAQVATMVLAAAIVVAWYAFGRQRTRPAWREELASALVMLTAGVAVFLSCFNYMGADDIRYLTVAWPWNVPIGFVVAFSLGYLLARPREAGAVVGQCNEGRCS